MNSSKFKVSSERGVCFAHHDGRRDARLTNLFMNLREPHAREPAPPQDRKPVPPNCFIFKLTHVLAAGDCDDIFIVYRRLRRAVPALHSGTGLKPGLPSLA